ncbi:MAG TPA: response regulator [Thermoanaerobaculia bacterium]|nr:response regulator [Thermoanaerobaculia bacterium]
MAQRTILLVEDDFDLRGEIQRLLEEAGYRVVPAGNGADALLILQHSDPPDLILLDLMLPLMSGWEFSAEVSRDARLVAIPRVILSSIADRREATVLRVPAENCVKKPFLPEELLSLIRALIP